MNMKYPNHMARCIAPYRTFNPMLEAPLVKPHHIKKSSLKAQKTSITGKRTTQSMAPSITKAANLIQNPMDFGVVSTP